MTSGVSFCFLATGVALAITGCKTIDRAVIASSGTMVGIEVASDATTGKAISANLGYKRGELAIVPTNLGTCTSEKHEEDQPTVVTCDAGAGGAETAEVLMELNYQGGFVDDPGIYQRLAVGREAVAQNGAVVMFARANDGNLDSSAANALARVAVAEEERKESRVVLIGECVKDAGGNFDPTLRDQRVDAAQSLSASVVSILKQAANLKAFLDSLRDDTDVAVDPIYNALPTKCKPAGA